MKAVGIALLKDDVLKPDVRRVARLHGEARRVPEGHVGQAQMVDVVEKQAGRDAEEAALRVVEAGLSIACAAGVGLLPAAAVDGDVHVAPGRVDGMARAVLRVPAAQHQHPRVPRQANDRALLGLDAPVGGDGHRTVEQVQSGGDAHDLVLVEGRLQGVRPHERLLGAARPAAIGQQGDFVGQHADQAAVFPLRPCQGVQDFLLSGIHEIVLSALKHRHSAQGEKRVDGLSIRECRTGCSFGSRA